MTKDDKNAQEPEPDDDNEVTESMSVKDRQKRIAELEAELAELSGEGELEDATDADIKQVAEDIEDAAEDIASEVEALDLTPADVEDAAVDAADDVAGELSKSGITLTEQEIEGLADRIARKVVDLQKGNSGDKKDDKAPKQRTPDRRPQSTHFSERQIFSRKKRD
jgi:hypothetical protein